MPAPNDPRSRLRALLAGPPPAWPQLVDRAAERWVDLAPRVRVGAIVALAVALSLLMLRVGARSPWGPDVAVLVSTRPVPAGATLDAGDLVPTVRPASTVPTGALVPEEAWVGRVVTGPLPEGVVVTDANLATDGLTELVAAGRVAVAVPASLLPPLDPGDRVDLLGGDGDRGGRQVARDGRVLAADGEHVWIEVDRDDAGAVAAVVAWGTVTIALLGR